MASFNAQRIVLIAVLATAASVLGASPTDDGAWQPIPRHAEEIRALVQPGDVLSGLPQRIDRAQAAGDWREVALLRLAHANACRVMANLDCQSEASRAAQEAARRAGDVLIEVRGLTMEASSAIADLDYATAEGLLAKADQRLKANPHPALAGDIFLAYSSVSFALGNHERSETFASSGLDALGAMKVPLVRVRLLRNKARAQSMQGGMDDAARTFAEALSLLPAGEDPRLQAELHLELARLGDLRGDPLEVRDHAQQALWLASQLDNAQLRGLAQEWLAVSALRRDEKEVARNWLDRAIESFHLAAGKRDERRVLRRKVALLLEGSDLEPLPRTVEQLQKYEVELDAEDQAHAAGNFESRLEHARQAFDLELLQQNVNAARERQRSFVLLGIMGIVLLLGMGGAFVMQRRQGERVRVALARANENEARYLALTDNVPAAIAQFDAEQRYVQANAHLASAVRRPLTEILGRSLRDVRGDAVYEQWKPCVERALRGERAACSSETEADGRVEYLSSVFVPRRNDAGEPDGFYSLTFDVTELTVAQRELEHLVRIDSLTGIANRRHFEERLAATLAHARRTKRGLAVLAIDVDRFKQINDTHGHAIGDAVLRAFAARVLACVRKDDFFARMGGDEFMLLIEEPPALAGDVVANKLIAAMQDPIVVDSLTLSVTISIGIAYAREGHFDESELLAAADDALYEAKRAGRNRYAGAGPG